MRIGIDARFFGVKRKGLGRYTQKLIENLEKVDTSNQYFIFLRSDNYSEYQPENSNFSKVLADFRWYSWQEQLKFPRLLKKYKLDITHFPHFNVPIFYFGRFIVTIHDLILLNFPTLKGTTLNSIVYYIKFLMYRIVIRSAIFRSSRLITVSKFTKKDIQKNFKTLPDEKIKVTYEACENFCMLSPNRDEEILARYGIIKPYIMYVGNAYPHKNLARLADAFLEVEKEKNNLKLVFVGAEDFFYKELKNKVKEGKSKNIIFTGYVPDYDLDILFHNSAAYVFPSLYEGFGLPPLEAMAKGVPVISSDHSCMREILGDSAYYFNGKEIDSIAKAIIKVLDNENLREELVHKGYAQTKKYSWRKMAEETLKIYQNIKF